ncbi:MAG TPA: tRNA (adenosine(37)-N6)-dimethylallyltransferase MiaA [Bryobacteraceae bacterium]|nr:tRNA (adenosine(37)-N6)-dimethylallyltransferase MiaA [Bryobacteraceae bacterium]
MTQPISADYSPLVVVLGPTGSGKSELALSLAENLSGEIVNCDSIQVYKGLDIGSAKTPVDHRRGIPHHLLDVIGPDEELSAGSYARMARQVVGEIQARAHIPIVAGGTGFYLRALLDGLSPAPNRDRQLRERLQQIESRRANALHRMLRRYDPLAAARIHPNDIPKLIRAIEIMSLSGETTTQAQSAPRQAFSGIGAVKLGLSPDRKLLYSRLNDRTAGLFANGLIEETRRLLQLGYAPDSKPMQSLGYKQAVQVIFGKLSVDSAIAECQIKTRQYAKRQVTWFRAERNVHWIDGLGSDVDVQQAALQHTITFLSNFGRKWMN